MLLNDCFRVSPDCREDDSPEFRAAQGFLNQFDRDGDGVISVEEGADMANALAKQAQILGLGANTEEHEVRGVLGNGWQDRTCLQPRTTPFWGTERPFADARACVISRSGSCARKSSTLSRPYLPTGSERGTRFSVHRRG